MSKEWPLVSLPPELSMKEIEASGWLVSSIPQIDREGRWQDNIIAIEEIVEEFKEEACLNGRVDYIDDVSGCLPQCQVCIFDVRKPTAMFASNISGLVESKLLSEQRIRKGFAGNLTDHPECLSMTEELLQQTNANLTLFSNYRPYYKEKIRPFIEMARVNNQVDLVISIPANDDYEELRESCDQWMVDLGLDSFIERSSQGDYLFTRDREVCENGIGVKCVPEGSFYVGGRAREGDVRDYNKFWYSGGRFRKHLRDKIDFERRGLIRGFLLNPDGLWVVIYATGFESHTGLVYVKVSQENISQLTRIPMYDDSLGDWPGGTRYSNKSDDLIEEEIGRIRDGGQWPEELKPLIVGVG